MDAAQRGRERSTPFRDDGEVPAHHPLNRVDARVHRRLVHREQAAALDDHFAVDHDRAQRAPCLAIDELAHR